MLNENNLQAAFQFNASDGSFVVEPIIGEITLSENDVRVVRQSGSDKMCVDLSYSIDAAPSDLIFKINNQICLIKVVAQRTDLVNISLRNNEVAIITNDPNFRTLVWTSTSNIGKHMYYEIKTINSGISNWQLNEIATKLNALNPGEIESKLTDLESKVITAEGLINTLDADLTVVEENLSVANDKIGLIETAIEVLPTLSSDVSELKTKTSDLESKTAGLTRADTTTTITDSLKLDSTLEVVGKSTVADLEVKGTLTVAGDSAVAKLTATEINTATVKNGNYKALFFREGTIGSYGTLMDMSVETTIIGANKKIMLKGKYLESESKALNNNEYYLKEIDLPFMFDSITRVVFRQSIDALFNLGSEAGTTNQKVKLGYRNVSGGSQNIGGKTRQFVIEGICNNIDSVPLITWIV